MRRFRITGAALVLEAEDLPAACKATDRLQQVLEDLGVELTFERVEGITADVVPLQRPAPTGGGHPA